MATMLKPQEVKNQGVFNAKTHKATIKLNELPPPGRKGKKPPKAPVISHKKEQKTEKQKLEELVIEKRENFKQKPVKNYME